MSKLIYFLLISMISYIGFIMYQQQDIGQVDIQFANFSFSTNLIIFIISILGLMLALVLSFKLLDYIKNNIFYFGNGRKQRLQKKAQLNLSQGLIEYAEGRFKRAETLLLQHIKFSDNKLLAYISAARAAQKLGEYDRRDQHLRVAHKLSPEADVAIGLTKAELQLSHKQYEQALATLSQLNENTENHSYILTLLANTYNQLEDWSNLDKLLPSLKKYAKPAMQDYLSLEYNCYKGQLGALLKLDHKKTQGKQALQSFWKKIPRHLTETSKLVNYYAKCLLSVDATDEAEKILHQYLSKRWDDNTITLYAELEFNCDNKRLETVEGWLVKHPNNAYLLLSLAKMCTSLSLWGKACNYFEASISAKPLPQTYLLLANLLEQKMGKVTEAQAYYRQGLHLLTGKPQPPENNTMLADKTQPKLKIVNP